MSSREEFENFAVSKGWDISKDSSGEYDAATAEDWLVWQAATERAAKVCDARNGIKQNAFISDVATRLAYHIRMGNE